MLNFIRKLIYFVLALQEKILTKKLRRSLKSSYSGTTSKKEFTQAASLELTSKTEQNKVKLEKEVKNILKECENDPHELLEFVRKNGTKIYKIPFANKVLRLVGYEEGFIIAKKGIKGLYINIIVPILAGEKIKLSLKAEPVFVLDNLEPDGYYIIQYFHKWYAMKLNLPGFDDESQNNFQEFLNSNNKSVESLSTEEVLGLKEAIARDSEAVSFVINLAKSTLGSKNALGKIIAEGGASV